MSEQSGIRVAVAGAAGRMGRQLLSSLIVTESNLTLSCASVKDDSEFVGLDAGVLIGQPNCGVALKTDLEIEAFDVLIDFTQPDLSIKHCAICAEHHKPVVLGTTGFSSSQLDEIQAYAADTPIVLAPNMSVGVNVLFHLLHQLACAVGEQADIEITETHHRNKLDSPSGTALRMGEIIADALGRKLSDTAVYGRNGVSSVRDQETIGFSSIRAGDVVGDHTALFALDGERLEITHKASSRHIYAAGAMRAAGWLVAQKNGLYDMQDVLGLRSNSTLT